MQNNGTKKEIVKQVGRFIVRRLLRRAGVPNPVATAVFLPKDAYETYKLAKKTYEERYEPHAQNMAWIEARARLEGITKTLEFPQDEKVDLYGLQPDNEGNLIYHTRQAYKNIDRTDYRNKKPMLETLDQIISSLEECQLEPEPATGIAKYMNKIKEKITSPEEQYTLAISKEKAKEIIDQLQPMQKEVIEILEYYSKVRGESGMDSNSVMRAGIGVTNTVKTTYKIIRDIKDKNYK